MPAVIPSTTFCGDNLFLHLIKKRFLLAALLCDERKCVSFFYIFSDKIYPSVCNSEISCKFVDE